METTGILLSTYHYNITKYYNVDHTYIALLFFSRKKIILKFILVINSFTITRVTQQNNRRRKCWPNAIK